jgi:hypothetical protein
MAFVAEDGTGLSTANSYISVGFADSYHLDRGNAAWALATEANRQAALIRATDYIDKRFGKRFKGWRQTKAQALEWPRLGAFDEDYHTLNGPDVIPRQLQKACAEYALRALTITTLAPDNDAVGLSLLREKVGPIETEKKISQGQKKSQLVDATSIPDYPEADLWMSELLSGTSRDLYRA